MTSSPAPDLPDLLVAAGLLTQAEADAIPPGRLASLARDPYGLTVPFDPALPPPALRWRWQRNAAQAFCRWVSSVLRARFGVPLEIAGEAGPDGVPDLLRLRLADQEEVCDWAYLNQARWMGAFCTIAARLLGPRGVEALELETGDFDVVLLFCRSEVADHIREWLPVAE